MNRVAEKLANYTALIRSKAKELKDSLENTDVLSI